MLPAAQESPEESLIFSEARCSPMAVLLFEFSHQCALHLVAEARDFIAIFTRDCNSWFTEVQQQHPQPAWTASDRELLCLAVKYVRREVNSSDSVDHFQLALSLLEWMENKQAQLGLPATPLINVRSRFHSREMISLDSVSYH